jgi:hypothetical protein
VTEPPAGPELAPVTGYVDPLGEPVTVEQWAQLCKDGGVGITLAETTVPTRDGDLIVRTKWFGTVFPELDVRPFGTATSPTASSPTGGCWSEREQYDTEAGARAGHYRWIFQLGTGRG